MARNNPEVQNRSSIARSTASHRSSNANSSTKYYGTSPKNFKSITPAINNTGDHHHHHQQQQSPRQSPRIAPSGGNASPPASLGSSPRTSPGLLAGHYAGCKFTEPPLPSALPLPPQHWMQQHLHAITTTPISSSCSAKKEPDMLAHQLKVLLKVQA